MYAITYGFIDELEKLADTAPKPKRSWVSRHGLKAGAMGLVALPMIGHLMSKYRSSRDTKNTYALLKRENPHGVASDSNFERHFATIKKFSPKMASDPVAAVAALRSLRHANGPSVESIGALHEIHKNESERSIGVGGIFGEAGERLLK